MVKLFVVGLLFSSSAAFSYPQIYYMNTDVGPGVGYEAAGSRVIVEAARNNPEVTGAVVGTIAGGGGIRAVVGVIVGEAAARCSSNPIGREPGSKGPR